MQKLLITLTLLCLLPFPETSYALEWNDLWKTQNQQAEKAFKQENYQQAADQFNNPQWKAAAQHKAGQFEQAIETLQDDQSATGLYNKGNALAKTGKLPEAIEAYDKSLELEPDNEDAKFNKEQVEKELEKRKQNQRQDDNNQESDQQDSQEKDKDEQGDSSEQSKQQDDSEQDSNSEQSEQQSEENSEPKESEQSQDNQQEKQQQETEEAESQAKSKQAAEQSEYDESKQANEQWLKRIPDDPAGLLKRKFKYQYGKRGRKTNNNRAW